MSSSGFWTFDFPCEERLVRQTHVENMGNGAKKVTWLKIDISNAVRDRILPVGANCGNCGDLRSGDICAPFRSNLLAKVRLGLDHPHIPWHWFFSGDPVTVGNKNGVCPHYIWDISIKAAVDEFRIGRDPEYTRRTYPNTI